MDGTRLLRTSLAAVVSTALLCSSSGCRTDPSMQLLERELRKQEDKIYRLKDSLALCREENEGLRRQLQGAGVPVAVPAPVQSVAPAASGPAAPAPPQIVAPPIPGTESTAPPAATPRSSQTAPQGPALAQGPALLPPAASAARPKAAAAAAVVLPDSRPVNQVTLNRARTGGFRGAGRPADEGLCLVIEPRDKQGRLLAAPGEIAVVVLDRAAEGEAARVARWDISRDQVTKLLPAATEGIYLELPWPGKTPAHRQLHVFVRYTTTDGRKLQVDQPLEIQLAGDGRGKWNALPPGAVTPAAKQPPVPASRAVSASAGTPAPSRSASPSATADVGKQTPSSSGTAAAEVVPAPAAQPLSSATKAAPASAPQAVGDQPPKRPVWSPNRN